MRGITVVVVALFAFLCCSSTPVLALTKYNVTAILADMTAQANKQLNDHFKIGIFQSVGMSPVTNSNGALFAELARMYRKVGPDLYQTSGSVVEAINALLQCQAQHGGKSYLQGQDQRLMSCMSKKDGFDTMSVIGRRSACKQCVYTVFIAAPASVNAALMFCQSLEMDAATQAMQTLQADANYMTDDELGVVNPVDPATGNPTPITGKIPKYISPTFDTIDAQMQSGGQAWQYTVQQDKSKFKMDSSRTSASANVGGGFFRFSGGGSFNMDSMNQAAATAGVSVDVSAEFVPFKVTPPSFFPTSIISSMYNQKGSEAWNTGKTGCRWVDFFGPTGSLTYTVQSVIIMKNYKSTFKIGATFDARSRSSLSAGGSISYWPFGASASHDEQHEASNSDGSAVAATSSTPDGDSFIYGVILGPIAGLLETPPLQQRMHATLHISHLSEIAQSVHHLRALVGPVLSPSLDDPQCGLRLLTCLEELSPHIRILQQAARSGDFERIKRVIGFERLCQCAPCLPRNKGPQVERALGCSVADWKQAGSGEWKQNYSRPPPRRRAEIDCNESASAALSCRLPQRDRQFLDAGDFHTLAERHNTRLLTRDECEEKLFASVFNGHDYSAINDIREALRLAHCEDLVLRPAATGSVASSNSARQVAGGRANSERAQNWEHESNYGSYGESYF